MYVLDPQTGRRRRAQARDKMIRYGRTTAEAIDMTAEISRIARSDWQPKLEICFPKNM
jgi:hypothetical protein